jgi:prophage maintenance system killer protein
LSKDAYGLPHKSILTAVKTAVNLRFVDGNKRTALIAGSTFLLVNNLRIEYANEEEEVVYAKEIETLVVCKDRERFLQWLRLRLKEGDNILTLSPSLYMVDVIEAFSLGSD